MKKKKHLLLEGVFLVLVGVVAISLFMMMRGANPTYAESGRFQTDTGGNLTVGLRSYLKMEDETDFWGSMVSYIVGSPAFDMGKVGGALVGDGYLQVSPGAALAFENTDTFSLAVWVQHTVPNGDSIVGKFVSGRGWRLFLENGRYVVVISSSHDGQDHYIQTQTRNVFLDGVWHLVVFTYDGSSRASGVRIYVDNVEQQLDIVSDTLDGSISTGMDAHIKIGVDKVDEVGVWDRVLSAREVDDLWNGGNGQTMVQEENPISVSIDIRPESKKNNINLDSHGTIPVAIFGSDTFDVYQINFSSTTLAGAPIRLKEKERSVSKYRDVNRDGFVDVVVYFPTDTLQLSVADTSAELKGFLLSGRGVIGSDLVHILQRNERDDERGEQGEMDKDSDRE